MNPSAILFFTLTALLYIITSRTQGNLARLFLSALSKNKIVVYILWFLYLPGIILHELAHLVVAIGLLLDVRSISLIPQIIEDENGRRMVKFGSVTYIKSDPIRGLLVGIAPFFFGTLCLILLFNSINFPNESFKLNAFFVYISFIISSTMFSSKKDLQDLMYVVPTVGVITVVFYLLNFNPFSYITLSLTLQKNGLDFLHEINKMFGVSLVINGIIYAIVRVIKR